MSMTVRHRVSADSDGVGGGAFPLDGLDGDEGIDGVAGGMGGGLQDRVQLTQERLAQLRREAEALEREKQQFEELSRKQRSFMEGRAEMGGRLGRAIGQLDREIYEAQKRVEQLVVIRDGFTRHREIIDSLNPEQWDPRDLPQDLTRALALIDDAREEYAKASAQLTFLAGGKPAAGPAAEGSRMRAVLPGGLPSGVDWRTFGGWVICGLAFSLPAAALALVIVLLARLAG